MVSAESSERESGPETYIFLVHELFNAINLLFVRCNRELEIGFAEENAGFDANEGICLRAEYFRKIHW